MSAPARFWPRYAAWSLDAAIASGLLAPLLWGRVAADAHTLQQRFIDLLDRFYGVFARQLEAGGSPLDVTAALADDTLRLGIATLEAALLRTLCVPVLAFAALMLVLHIAGERSRWQGSPGKRALGLRVVTRDGTKPGFARTVARQLAGLLSWLTFNIGHAMAAIPPEHLALHDRLSGTRVVRATAQSLPAWVRGWILLQAAIAALLMLLFTAHLASLAQAAVQRVLG